MKKTAIFTVCLLFAATSASPSLGQKPPGMTPEVFAPGVVSRDGIQVKLTMSADGSQILYTERDPATTAVSFIIRHRKGDSWSEPVVLPLAQDYMDLEPSLCPDGKTIFFTSIRPPSGKGEPEKLPDIWMTEKTEDQWGSPVHLGPPVNTGAADIEAHPFIGPDGALYFLRQVEKTRHLVRAARRGGGFDEPQALLLKEDLFAEQFSGPCLSPDGRILLMHSRKPGGFGNWDLYVAFKDESGGWSEFKNLGPVINTDKQEAHPSFSPDGRSLFFDRDGDILWISAKILYEKSFAQADIFFGKASPGPEPVKFLSETLHQGLCPHGQLAFVPDGSGVFWSAIALEGRRQTIYWSAFDGKAFSTPVVAPFAAEAGNGGPAFSPDGRRLFFNVEIPGLDATSPKTMAIAYVERSGSGWTKSVTD